MNKIIYIDMFTQEKGEREEDGEFELVTSASWDGFIVNWVISSGYCWNIYECLTKN